MKQLDDDLLKADDCGDGEPHHSGTNGRTSSPSRQDNDLASDTPTDDENEISTEKEEKSENLQQGGLPDLERHDGDLFFFDLKGDKMGATPAEKVHIELPERSEQPSSSSEDEVILFRGRGRGEPHRTKSTMALTQMKNEIQIVEEDIRISLEGCGQSGNRSKAKNLHKKRWQRSRRRNSEDDAFLADYIANMEEHGEIHNLVTRDTRNTRDLGGSADETGATLEIDSDSFRHGSPRLEDPSVANQEGRSTRIPQETLTVRGASNHQSYSESELDDLTFARLIEDQASSPIPDTVPRDDTSSSSSSSSGENPPQLDEFDVMDWDRPSLRRKKGKAARTQISFDMSDSELEQTLQAAWRSDRLKKSQRKKQREELRALGMLGKKGRNPEDLRVKYPMGINMQQVAEEIKGFLLGIEAT